VRGSASSHSRWLASSHSFVQRQGCLVALTQPRCGSHPQVQDGQITHIQYEQGSQFLQEPQVRGQAAGWSWQGCPEAGSEHPAGEERVRSRRRMWVGDSLQWLWPEQRSERDPAPPALPGSLPADPVHACLARAAARHPGAAGSGCTLGSLR